MASALSFSIEDAIASIKEKGLYKISDAALGQQVVEFRRKRLPTKTEYGLDFIAENALSEGVRAVAASFLKRPRWGFLKVYSDELPADLAFFVHNRTTTEMPALLIQLWPPNSRVRFYTGAHLLVLNAGETEWGLLGLASHLMNVDGIIEEEFDMKDGGLYVLNNSMVLPQILTYHRTIIDSRLGFTIAQRYSLNVAYVTHDEIEEWAPMELPDLDPLRKKVDEIQRQGIGTNFKFVKPSGGDQDVEQNNAV